MSTTNKEPTKPAYEVHYRRTQAGEFEFVRSTYTPVSGALVKAGSGDFDDDVGAKAAQLCLLNLKLQLEGHTQQDSKGQFRVLESDLARPFAQSIKKIDASKWHRALFGDEHQFLFAQSTSNPVIVIRGAHAPTKVDVQFVEGVGSDEKMTLLTAPDKIREIVASVERRIVAKRVQSKTSAVSTLGAASLPGTSIAEQRAERAWGALEDFIIDLANPDTPSNKLYGIDRLNDTVWRSAETYVYLGLQSREYTRANYNSRTRKWNIIFSGPVLEAIKRAVEVAKKFLPNHDGEGHSLTAFDDWHHPQSAKAGKPKFEIVRILIWPKERLLSQEAFAVARLHKIYNIPLFFLEPSSLQDDPHDEYILFCKDGDTPKTAKRDLRGLAWDASRNDWQQVRDLGYHPLAHFQRLLQHPKLVFAIDAREMLKQGKWSSFAAADSG